MDTIQLNAEPRDKSVKAKALRGAQLIPGEIYGFSQENLSVQMEYQVFRKAYIAAGENTVIDLTLSGKSPRKVLVHQVDFHPVSGKITHVDFVNVNMKKEVHTHVPLEFVGMSTAVKDLGGMLMTALDELEVKCLPADLIHSIEVDITGLVDFHTSIHVRDVKVPSTITVLNDPDLLVASIAAPRVEEEPVVAEAAAVVPEAVKEESAA